jgi:drug/metabolite transporter (DMT)-like permease
MEEQAKSPLPVEAERAGIGMAAAMGAFFLFSIMLVFAKLLSERHSVIEIAFYRNLIGTLPFLVMIFAFGRKEILVLRSKPSLVGLRAALGAVSLSLTFAAFSLMPMADATALLFSSSLFIPFLALFLLKESVGAWRWSAVFIGFLGVFIMARPGGEVNMLGVTVALSAAFIQGIMAIILRYLGKHESPETISFYFMVVGTILTALALPFIAVQPTLEEIPLFFGVGLTGAAAQWLLSLAFRHARAAVVAVLNYSSIIWSTLFGWLIFSDWPLLQVFIGGGIVIAANLVIVWRESRRGRLTHARVQAKL